MEAAFEDDDFGELYADVELLNATVDFANHHVQSKPEPEAKSYVPNLNDKDLVDDSVYNELTRSVAKDDSFASDSDDDDLKIVLNDDECNDFAIAVGCDDEDADEDGLVSKNEVKGGYGSRFFHHKYTRNRGGSMFVNNTMVNKSMGTVSSLNRGRWNGDACSQHLASSPCHVNRIYSGNSMVTQCGFGSFLPWHWNIFDVNIDTLESKPWRVPGANVTDYFNFDFNENTWKLYCSSLEQLWRTSVQTGIPVDESAKWNQETMREQIYQVVSGSLSSPPSDCDLPKGRAILVENSTVERQPSMDAKRPRSRDSDVIIQIKVLESSDDCSGSGNSIAMDASLEGESVVGNNKNILNSSSEHDDVLSEDQLEDVKKSEVSSVQERNGPALGVDEVKHQDQADQYSEDTSQVAGTEINVEKGIVVGTCSADPCWIESELSLGNQELSLTTYSDSDSDATGNSVHDDSEKGRNSLRRQSVNSVSDMKEYLPLYSNNSKNDRFNRKPANAPYHSRNGGPLRKEWSHQSGGIDSGSDFNRHIENDNAVSAIRMSSTRGLSLSAHQFVHHDSYKERVQDFGSRKRRDVSYNRETQQSCYFDGETFVDDLVQIARAKYSYREDRESLRENTNRYDRRNVDERNHFFEPRSPMEHSEGRERDWYHADWGYSADELSPHSYRESRQFLRKHPSFPAKGRDLQRRRTNEKSNFRDGSYNDDFYECESEFPHIDRNWERSDRRGRHHDRPSLVSDNLCWKIEDKCPKYTHQQASNYRYRRESSTDSGSNYVHDTRVNENFGDCRRHKHATENRGSDWPCGYTDAAEDEDFIISPVEEYQFYRSPSEVLNWTEDETIYRYREIQAASLHTVVQIDDRKMQHHQLNIPRRGSENCLKGSSKIRFRGKHWQAVQRCRKSVDFVNGEGKSYAISSGVLCNGRLENVDRVIIAKKRKATMSFDESHKKRLQNHQDKRQEEDLNIEEGQIVTEGSYKKASVSRRDISEGVTPNDSVKKRMSQNDNSSDQLIGVYDNQRILDSLAKMEKRRERFKQPITMKKEAEENLKSNNDSIIDAGEMKQYRPARKRQWVGS
ncbi:hypothetical protein TanjilG_27040 [Lupinus angustifolius]|uniref:Pre-mRNA polyadenylation factor Fip1 domain-containing protein n=1 Tax=Lupinus angustifolius TaxID=3871 RepID=A0A4P1QVP9_LUPAN|nr:PREDICTED: FIP1[III]-like protein [Lupinus angustifolius]OIV95936.1 hypothetical protein TanjilG_27040 [Lupinus angustifolius]